MILYINACVRKESRTKVLADHLIGKLLTQAERKGAKEEVEEVDLGKVLFPVADEEFINHRVELEEACAWDDPMFDLAKQFARADQVVVAAPYWDLSFPAALKQYFEQINVMGITFEYTPEGTPRAMCQAEKLYYVMTAGGVFCPEEFGFGYVRAMSESFYGIKEFEYIQALGLDIDGADEKKIVGDAIREIDKLF